MLKERASKVLFDPLTLAPQSDLLATHLFIFTLSRMAVVGATVAAGIIFRALVSAFHQFVALLARRRRQVEATVIQGADAAVAGDSHQLLARLARRRMAGCWTRVRAT